MRSILSDRSVVATAALVMFALGYAACGETLRPTGVTYAGCVSAVDCIADGYAPGSTCAGGYCISPEVRRECTSSIQCRMRGLGECVMNNCEPPAPPVEVDAYRDDAEGRDVGALPDAIIEPIDAFIPTSGAA